MRNLELALTRLELFIEKYPKGLTGFCITHEEYKKSPLSLEEYIAKHLNDALDKAEKGKKKK